MRRPRVLVLKVAAPQVGRQVVQPVERQVVQPEEALQVVPLAVQLEPRVQRGPQARLRVRLLAWLVLLVWSAR